MYNIALHLSDIKFFFYLKFLAMPFEFLFNNIKNVFNSDSVNSDELMNSCDLDVLKCYGELRSGSGS